MKVFTAKKEGTGMWFYMFGAEWSSISLDLRFILQRSKVGFESLSFFDRIKKYSQQCDFLYLEQNYLFLLIWVIYYKHLKWVLNSCHSLMESRNIHSNVIFLYLERISICGSGFLCSASQPNMSLYSKSRACFTQDIYIR